MLGSGISPDKYTFPSVIKACGGVNNVRLGKAIYDTIQFMGFGVDIFVGSSLIQLYVGNGCIHDAWCLFVEMPHKDCVLWNVMLHGYVKNGESKNAVGMFLEMRNSEIKPNAVTFACILSVCASEAMIGFGTQLHEHIPRCSDEIDYQMLLPGKLPYLDAIPGGESILAYAYEGTAFAFESLESTQSGLGVEIKVHKKNTAYPRGTTGVLPSSTSNGLVLNGMNNNALEIFRWLLKEKMRPNSLTLASVLPACAGLVALKLGKELHGNILKHGLDGRLHLGSALTDIMFERDTICWNSMITSYSQNGKPFRSDLFAESALIDVYAKCGNLVLARSVFDMMEEKNEVSWNSIISAYGSHGCLQDSLVLFHEMLGNGILLDHVTFLDSGVWGTLLGACRVHGNVELAEEASRHLFDLEPQNSGYFILLSNIHADAGKWGSVLKVRSLMKERGVQKVPGYSWIEVNNNTHMYVAADGSHPQSAQIYSMLKSLLLELRKEGYNPQPYLPTHPQTSGM
ncbi:unnamed protein product [Prunus armeniaca]